MADWQAIAELLAAALGAVDKVVERMSGPEPDPIAERAKDALTVIGAIVSTVKTGNLEQLDAETARAELDRVIAALDASDEGANKALENKFDNSDT
jgi:hypothetical protein